jgi:D-xylose transport system substrate-binding protein
MLILIIVFSINSIFSQEIKKVGISLSDLNADRWLKETVFMEREFESEGIKPYRRIANQDPTLQFKQCVELIDSGCKVIIIVASDSKRTGIIADEANKRKVKIVCYDRLILNSKPDYYVSFDNIKIGEMQANYAVERAPEGNYVVLSGPESDYNAVLFRKGEMNVLKPLIDKGKINLVFDPILPEWNSMIAFSALQDKYEDANFKVDAILGTNDKLAAGAIMYMEMLSKEFNIVITGMDASLDGCRNIIAGKQSMSIFKPGENLAKETVALTLNLLNNKPIITDKTVNNFDSDIPAILLEPVIITKKNINSLIVEKYKYWTREEIY